jgi:hypothetical protein
MSICQALKHSRAELVTRTTWDFFFKSAFRTWAARRGWEAFLGRKREKKGDATVGVDGGIVEKQR